MSDQSRRKLLKSIAAGSGAIVAGQSLPESWSKPVVDSVMLPAHAMTSPGNQYTNSQNALLDSQSRLARVMDSLVPEAKAAHGGGPTETTCLTITGESTVKIEGLIDNDKGFALVTAQNVTVAGAAVSMDITQCDDPSEIGQITVQVATLTNASATGTYNIGNSGTNLVNFTVTPGVCSAPVCPPCDIAGTYCYDWGDVPNPKYVEIDVDASGAINIMFTNDNGTFTGSGTTSNGSNGGTFDIVVPLKQEGRTRTFTGELACGSSTILNAQFQKQDKTPKNISPSTDNCKPTEV